jgi:hypothetical protein
MTGIQSPMSTLADGGDLAMSRGAWSCNGPTTFHVSDKHQFRQTA